MKEESTADPYDWDEVKNLLHIAVDEMLDWLRTIRDREPWKPIPEEVKSRFTYPWMDGRKPLDHLYEEFKEYILPYPSGNIHPRYWGWVNGTGLVEDLLVEMLIATMNSNVGGREHIANYVERQVLNWFKDLFGFPSSSSGILTSGCSVANLIGLTVARTTILGDDLRVKGQAEKEVPIFYGSSQVHSSIIKALEITGVGRKNFREIAVNDRFEIDIKALEAQILKDIDDGLKPVCIIGNIATVNTGAIDDIGALNEIASKFGLWLHIDAAFGAALAISRLKGKLSDIEKADSIAFDFHKWFYIQYEVGCILIKDERAHRRALSLRPDYLAEQKRGAGSGGHWFTEYGLQLSRNFKALKPWFLLQLMGKRRYEELINKNLDQAQYVADLVKRNDSLQLMAPVATNVVCFRFFNKNLSNEQLELLNQEILHELHEQGIAIPSSTKINGAFVLRIAIVNHRSKFEDFEILVKEVERIGKSLLSSGFIGKKGHQSP